MFSFFLLLKNKKIENVNISLQNEAIYIENAFSKLRKYNILKT